MTFIRTKLYPHRWRLALLVVIPLIAHAGILTGFMQCDPEMAYSQMVTSVQPALLRGAACYVDPGVGAITQPLGYLSAQDWLHGIIPWWNPYNGVGMPLAASMQPESFFLPIVLLLHFHSGWIMQLLIFEIASGLLTYAFLLEIGISTGGAFLGAAVFSLNGTFILTPGAVSAPIMFLPLLMLGIEYAAKAAGRGTKGGWSLIVIAVAGSIYAGFPMVAYFDGLLAAAWSVLRFLQMPAGRRLPLLAKLCLGCGIGVALTAPLLNAFFQDLQTAFLGIQMISGQLKLPPMAAPLQIFPLFYGALAAYPPFGLNDQGLWIRIGGWFGCIPFLLGLYALIGNSQQRAAKCVLAAWILAFQARYFGAPGFMAMFNLIPGISFGDVVRFSTTASEFALITLAAWGYSELETRQKLSPARLALLVGCFSLCIAAAIFPVRNIISVWFTGYPALLPFAAIYMSLSAIGCLIIIGSFLTRRFIQAAQSLAISGAIGVMLISEGGASRGKTYDPSVLTYLQNTHSLTRFYTLGPVMPNLAARYDVASINHLMLPVPKIWTDFVKQSLFPASDLAMFAGNQTGQPAALRRNMSNFQNIGVGSILTVAGENPFNKIFLLQADESTAQYSGFSKGDDVSGTIAPLHWSILRIDMVSLTVGTFFGQSRGRLNIKLCVQGNCTTGSVSLDRAADNKPLLILLGKPLDAPAFPASLTYELSHPDGTQVAITLADQPDVTVKHSSRDQISRHMAPYLGFIQGTDPEPPIIFHNQSVDLYALPNPAPYMQTTDPDCTLTIISRQHAVTDCPHPSSLIRRELFYAGWRVSVNRSEQPITVTDEIFQNISLPGGHADIHFSYMPLHTRSACAIALAALALWLGCLIHWPRTKSLPS